MDAKRSDPTPPFAQSPLSPLGVEGFDGGPREKGNGALQGNGRPQRSHAWRAAQGTLRGRQPHEGSPTGQMVGPLVSTALCAAYTCGSGFSLLYVTEGRSPTSVRCTGGKAWGPSYGWRSDKCGPESPLSPIKLEPAGGGVRAGRLSVLWRHTDLVLGQRGEQNRCFRHAVSCMIRALPGVLKRFRTLARRSHWSPQPQTDLLCQYTYSQL